ncbi:dispanin subfamily A member 2b-like [Sparus aurata]|uniref:Interferon-induced transmembrane protein 3-like n=1 Tax=Sparus aurata TaxID=8175 RepID=A0A671UGV8_SPAAU|nr:dispanin subfamily A member 2b-like [Sparus aurata]XP_030280915.1 dispanin subfamily A member 2b-like [Sparus aurata]
MNPAGQLGEPVPLQERYDWSPGQPRGPAVGQYTTLNISSEPPKDHIIWSLYCFVYSNPFCLGLAALIFSIKARDRRMAGDLDGARHYASKARCLNIWATVIGSIIIISSFIFIVIALFAR